MGAASGRPTADLHHNAGLRRASNAWRSAGRSLVEAARRWLRSQPGGVAAIPTWGKFWLSILGLYSVDGISALPPELFVAPGGSRFIGPAGTAIPATSYLAMAYRMGGDSQSISVAFATNCERSCTRRDSTPLIFRRIATMSRQWIFMRRRRARSSR